MVRLLGKTWVLLLGIWGELGPSWCHHTPVGHCNCYWRAPGVCCLIVISPVSRRFHVTGGPVTHHENRQKPAYDGTIQDQSLICVTCESSAAGNRHAVTRIRLLCACSFLTVSTGRERESIYKNSIYLLYLIYCLSKEV